MDWVLAIATRLAAVSPDASLPCPLCGASLRAVNLERHVEKVHGSTAPATSAAAGPLMVTGVDRRAVRTFVIPVVLWVGLSVGGVLAGIGSNDGIRWASIALLLVALGPLVLAALDLLRARLILDGDELRLRYALGLRELRVRLPCALEVGVLTEQRPVGPPPYTSELNDATEEVRAGVYLRLGDALTLGAPKGTGFRTHWLPEAWRSGPRRPRCDLLLDRLAMIAVEYHLAGRGQLAPR